MRFVVDDVLPEMTKEDLKQRFRAVMEERQIAISDARTALPGGLKAWQLDTHGFVAVETPPFPPGDFLETPIEVIQKEYYPKLVELAKRQIPGCKDAFVLSHFGRAKAIADRLVMRRALSLHFPATDPRHGMIPGDDEAAQIRSRFS